MCVLNFIIPSQESMKEEQIRKAYRFDKEKRENG